MVVSFTEYMVALRGSNLAGSTRSIALWVASRCSDGWPVTREVIAEDSGFSRATVSRALAELFKLGWLVPSRNRRQGNSYELAIPRSLSAHSEPLKETLSAHGEPTEGSQRAYQKAHSEPLRVSLSAHDEPTVGSQRAYKKAHGEPTYIRTKQEHTKTNLARTPAPARTHAREGVESVIKHSDVNQGLLWTWVNELEKIPEAKNEVLRFKSYRTPENEIYKNAFVTALLTSERLFEHFKPWFEQLREEGRI